MRRKMMSNLIAWKNENMDMPYMLVGARQVGKTYLIEEFCKEHFEDYLYLNLEQDEEIREVFEASLRPQEIIESIGILIGKKIVAEKTAIFIDEIQMSERAITSLKYFNEAQIRYTILTAGSLLGVALNRFKGSFPVGKVYMNTLHPMEFEEYLWAVEQEMLAQGIEEAYKRNSPLPKPVHERALSHYRNYLYIGGMPASILEFLKKECSLNDYDSDVKRRLIDQYLADMSQYTSSGENLQIGKVYRSLPRQLGNDSKKFKYNLVEEKGDRRKFESSIDWLVASRLVSKCTRIEVPRLPLNAYENTNFFKLYANDVGLLMEMARMSPRDLIGNEANLYRGFLTENYVAQMLVASGAELHFWKSKHNAEIDFLIHHKGKIIPVEVKAATNTKSKSLNVYREKYNPSESIRLSMKNFGLEGGIRSLPLYAAHLLLRDSH